MYLTHDEYTALGGRLDADAYAPLEAEAEAMLDELTMGRVADMPQPYPGCVARAMYYLVGQAGAISGAEASAASGSQVSSFSNGVDSFGFVTSADAGYNAAWELAKARVVAMLPVALVSRAVRDVRRPPRRPL